MNTLEIILYIVASVASLIIGYTLGVKSSAIRALKLGRDLEFYIFAQSMKTLEKQEPYKNLFVDLQPMYDYECDKLKNDLSKDVK